MGDRFSEHLKRVGAKFAGLDKPVDDVTFLTLCRRIESLYAGEKAGWFPIFEWRGIGSGDVTLILNCGTVFGPCVHYEKVTPGTVERLAAAIADCERADPDRGAEHAVALFACRQRGRRWRDDWYAVHDKVRPLFEAIMPKAVA